MFSNCFWQLWLDLFLPCLLEVSILEEVLGIFIYFFPFYYDLVVPLDLPANGGGEIVLLLPHLWFSVSSKTLFPELLDFWCLRAYFFFFFSLFSINEIIFYKSYSCCFSDLSLVCFKNLKMELNFPLFFALYLLLILLLLVGIKMSLLFNSFTNSDLFKPTASKFLQMRPLLL